jgi:hypothetical protein
MRRIGTVVHIQAAPELVWQVLVDFSGYPRWSPQVTLAGRPEQGRRLQVTAAAPGANGMRFNALVLAAEPARLLRWRGRVLLPGLCDGVHEFVLAPLAGGTQLVHAENFSGLLLPFLGAGLRRTEQHMDEQNLALKRQAESRVLTP